MSTPRSLLALSGTLISRYLDISNVPILEIACECPISNPLDGSTILGSISSTFYAQIFCTNVVSAAFLLLHVRISLVTCM